MKRITYQLLLIFTFFSSWGENRCRALDLNGDGMSDIWQAKYGIAANDRDSDTDGDGYTNAEEALFGTDPTNPKDFPRATSVTRAYNPITFQNEVTLTWRSIEGVYYVVEQSRDMKATPWAPVVLPSGAALGQSFGGAGTSTTLTFPFYPTSRMFYRIKASATSMPVNFTTDVLNFEKTLWGGDPATMDTDLDGMPDLYEINNGLKPFVDDANADPDGDGMSNLEEYLNGTNPKVAGVRADGYGVIIDRSTFDFTTSVPYAGGTHYFENFSPNPNAGTKIGNTSYSTYYTEVFDRATRQAADEILSSAVTSYEQDFRSSVKALSVGRGSDLFDPRDQCNWQQGNIPDETSHAVALTDVEKATHQLFITIEAGSVDGKYDRTFIRPLTVVDQSADWGNGTTWRSIDLTQPTTVYSGYVQFTVPMNSRFSTICNVVTGSLPPGLVSSVEVTTPNTQFDGISAASAKIILTPTGPNQVRFLNPVAFQLDPLANEATGWDDTGPEPWTTVGVGKTNSRIVARDWRPNGNDPDYFDLEVLPAPGSEAYLSVTNVTPIEDWFAFDINGLVDSAALGVDGAKIIVRHKAANGEVGSGPLQTLHVHVLPPRTVNFRVFAASDDHVPLSSLPSAIKTVQQITTELNATFNNQANITFTPLATDPVVIDKCLYGFASDGAVYFYGQSVGREFSYWIDNQAKLAAPGTDYLKIFIVNKIVNIPSAIGITAYRRCFVNADADIRVFSHETGHAMGLATAGNNFPKGDPRRSHDIGLGPFGEEALMSLNKGHQTRWMRQQDWRAANTKAADTNYDPAE